MDGITAESLRKVNNHALQVLFNMFLVAESMSRWLREGVVTLVSEVNSPLRPLDYRPINVSSHLLQCFFFLMFIFFIEHKIQVLGTYR